MTAHDHLNRPFAVCRSFKGYEEVSVPAVKPAAPPAGEELVKISEMEEWAQLPFAGYKYALSNSPGRLHLPVSECYRL